MSLLSSNAIFVKFAVCETHNLLPVPLRSSWLLCSRNSRYSTLSSRSFPFLLYFLCFCFLLSFGLLECGNKWLPLLFIALHKIFLIPYQYWCFYLISNIVIYNWLFTYLILELPDVRILKSVKTWAIFSCHLPPPLLAAFATAILWQSYETIWNNQH